MGPHPLESVAGDPQRDAGGYPRLHTSLRLQTGDEVVAQLQVLVVHPRSLQEDIAALCSIVQERGFQHHPAIDVVPVEQSVPDEGLQHALPVQREALLQKTLGLVRRVDVMVLTSLDEDLFQLEPVPELGRKAVP